MKKIKKTIVWMLVSAFALCLLTSCSGVEKREYTLPSTVTVTRNDGRTVVFTFTYDGNKVTVKEDGELQGIEVCNDAGFPTEHQYYELGERRSTLTYQYDKEGRLIRQTHDDKTQEYTEQETIYDNEGREKEAILKTKNGDVLKKVVYEYGENGSRTEKTYNGDGSLAYSGVYTFDGEGRMTEYAHFFRDETVPSNRQTWEYDENGLPVRECVYNSNGELDTQKAYAYDEQGRETRMQRTYGDGTPSSRTETVYAADGNYTVSTYYGEGVLSSRDTYGPDGKPLEERNYSDGEESEPIVIVYTYDGEGFLTCVEKSSEGAVWESREITDTCTVSLTEEAYRFFMTMVERYAF